MKVRQSIIAIMLGMSVLVSGCTSTTPETNTKKETEENTETVDESTQSQMDVIQPTAYGNVKGLNLEPGTSISIIGRGKNTAYWDAVKEGAQEAAKEINELLGYEGDDKVKVVYSAPEEEGDVDEQVNILDEELARYPAAIGIAAVDMYACEVQFDLAIENNIPIVAFDAGTDYQNIVSLVKTDDQDAAKMAANKLSDLIGDDGKVVIVAHDTNSMTATDRVDSFTNQIEKKHDGIEIVDVYHLDDLKTRAKELIEANSNGDDDEDGPSVSDFNHVDILKSILEEHPDVKAFYATSESASVVIQDTLEELGIEGMTVVSFDGGESQIERLKEGKISGLIVQNPYGIGYATVVAAARAILGQGNEAVVDTGYTWVTESNLEKPSIQNMMY